MSVYLPIYLSTYLSRATASQASLPSSLTNDKKLQAIGQNKTIVALKTKQKNTHVSLIWDKRLAS